MKRVVDSPFQQDLFEETPRNIIKRLESLRAKVVHNNPLSPTERDELRKILKDHPNANEILKKLQAQHTSRRNYALTMEERESVSQTIIEAVTSIREKIANSL